MQNTPLFLTWMPNCTGIPTFSVSHDDPWLCFWNFTHSLCSYEMKRLINFHTCLPLFLGQPCFERRLSSHVMNVRSDIFIESKSKYFLWHNLYWIFTKLNILRVLSMHENIVWAGRIYILFLHFLTFTVII